MACILLCSSAARVHAWYAYRLKAATSASISLILDARAMLSSFDIAFSLVSAAIVCAIQEMISGCRPHVLLMLSHRDYLHIPSCDVDRAFVILKGVSHDPLHKTVERVREGRQPNVAFFKAANEQTDNQLTQQKMVKICQICLDFRRFLVNRVWPFVAL